VALGLAGENGMALLGLSARSTEIGDGRSRSLLAASADSSDPTARDKGEKVWEYHDVVVSQYGGVREGRGSLEGFAIAVAD
jgi:hypothetical protein